MFCTKCGNFLADDARFCNSCGQPNKGYSDAIYLKSTTNFKGNKILLYVWCSLLLCYAAFEFLYILWPQMDGYRFFGLSSIYLLTSWLALLGFGIIPLCPIKPDLYRKLLMFAFILEMISGVVAVTQYTRYLIRGSVSTLVVLLFLLYALWSAFYIYITCALVEGTQKLNVFKIVLLCGAIILTILYAMHHVIYGFYSIDSLIVLVGMPLTFFFPFIALPSIVKVKQR